LESKPGFGQCPEEEQSGVVEFGRLFRRKEKSRFSDFRRLDPMNPGLH
jgi:hypothetical protein